MTNLARFSAAIEPASVKPRQSQAFKHPQSQVSDVPTEDPIGLGTAGSQAVPSQAVPRLAVAPKAKRAVPKRKPARKSNVSNILSSRFATMDIEIT